MVHNHNPEEGEGLACRETRLPNGSLKGRCLMEEIEKEVEKMEEFLLVTHPDFDTTDGIGYRVYLDTEDEKLVASFILNIDSLVTGWFDPEYEALIKEHFVRVCRFTTPKFS